MKGENVYITPTERRLIEIIKSKLKKSSHILIKADDLFKEMWDGRDDNDEYDYERYRRMMINNMRYVRVKLLLAKLYRIERASKLGPGRRAVYRVEKF